MLVNLLKNKYVCGLVLIGIIYYLWNQNKSLKIYYFMRDDCKYCIEMKDAWDKVELKLQNSRILCKKININEPKYKNIKDNFNFKTVPHIVKIYNDGTRNVFEGERTGDEIIAWAYKDMNLYNIC
jgi:glutaredoxin